MYWKIIVFIVFVDAKMCLLKQFRCTCLLPNGGESQGSRGTNGENKKYPKPHFSKFQKLQKSTKMQKATRKVSAATHKPPRRETAWLGKSKLLPKVVGENISYVFSIVTSCYYVNLKRKELIYKEYSTSDPYWGFPRAIKAIWLRGAGLKSKCLVVRAHFLPYR